MERIYSQNIDLDNIKVDPYWNISDQRELKIHRIHAYPAKFPAFIAQKAFSYAANHGVAINRVADIFCGCGTVAFEAKREGIDFWGYDINPVAVLIAKAKSYQYESSRIKKYNKLILSMYHDIYNEYTIGQVNERIIYWFSERNIFELSLLKHCIYNIVPANSKYKYFFLCAFSNILKSASRWLTKSIKPQIDPHKIMQAVIDLYSRQIDFMIEAIEESYIKNNSHLVIRCEDSTNIKKREAIDFIVTSPPYVTSYEYADLHQLTALWLDFTDDYRTLRKNAIGSSYVNIKRDSVEINPEGKSTINNLFKVDTGQAKSVERYFADMQIITNICYNLLVQNGAALFVIGNTEYKGVKINNAQHLIRSLYDSGFSQVWATKRRISNKLLTPYRDELGRFSRDHNSRKIYSEEFIIYGRK